MQQHQQQQGSTPWHSGAYSGLVHHITSCHSTQLGVMATVVASSQKPVEGSSCILKLCYMCHEMQLAAAYGPEELARYQATRAAAASAAKIPMARTKGGRLKSSVSSCSLSRGRGQGLEGIRGLTLMPNPYV